MFSVIGSLDLNGWLRGLIGAGISGGASAITGGLVVSGMDPNHYSFQAGKFWILVGTLFMANAVVSMAKFLQNDPLPSKVTTVRERSSTIAMGSGDKIDTHTTITTTVQSQALDQPKKDN